MKTRLVATILLCFILSGCASFTRLSPTYHESIKKVKTIAVLPADIKVYKLSAGGVKELIDEWSDMSKAHTRKALRKHLEKRFNFEVKFIEEEWLKANHKELWRPNQALYQAITMSTFLHAYGGPQVFSTKTRNFDYSMGEEVAPLAQALNADSLLFIYGFDHEASAGRKALWLWNFSLTVFTGVNLIPSNPSGMAIGFVDGKTGNLEWLKVSPPEMEYSFRSEKHMDALIEWLTRDFVTEKK